MSAVQALHNYKIGREAERSLRQTNNKTLRELNGALVRVRRSRSEFFAEITATSDDRVRIKNTSTEKEYWIIAADIVCVVYEPQNTSGGEHG